MTVDHGPFNVRGPSGPLWGPRKPLEAGPDLGGASKDALTGAGSGKRKSKPLPTSCYVADLHQAPQPPHILTNIDKY